VRTTAEAERAKLRNELTKAPYRIVFERFDDRDWDLFMMKADGSRPVNLTHNAAAHEMYPHASPDGRRICFVADEGTGRSKVRSVYTMNADGSGRTLVAANARQPCWSPDGKTVLYAKGEYDRFTYSSYGTKGLFFYDVATGTRRQHPNRSILHVCYLCWAPGGRWILGTVHGGMGFGHANLAIEADGRRVFDLRPVQGCRPDVRPDGKKIAWNATDQIIVIADLDLTSQPPKVGKPQVLARCDKKHKVYHADWSPDGKYVAFSYGPDGSQHVGQMARGWHICVADAAQRNVWVVLTKEGLSNKEPDWLHAPGAGKGPGKARAK